MIESPAVIEYFEALVWTGFSINDIRCREMYRDDRSASPAVIEYFEALVWTGFSINDIRCREMYRDDRYPWNKTPGCVSFFHFTDKVLNLDSSIFRFNVTAISLPYKPSYFRSTFIFDGKFK